MNSLFLKIFLWFWVAMLGIGGAFVVAEHQWASRPALPNAAEMRAYAGELERLSRSGGPGAVREYLHSLTASTDVRMALVGPNGQLPYGRRVRPDVQRMLEHERREALDHGRARQVHLAGEGDYVLLALRPRRRFHDLPGWVRLLIALVVVSGVSLLSAAHLSRPIRRVREATRKLAAGDLAVRVPEAGRYSRDEASELGRDFNAMAGRVQSLVEAQNQLLRDVSHELRSPLARLQVALELARQRSVNRDDPVYDRMDLEIERLDQLIGQVLTLARMESGAVAPRKETLDLAELVESVARDAQFEARAEDKDVSIDVVSRPQVSVDRSLIRSAVENVLRNAVRHAPVGTAVEVCVNTAAREAVITIVDHGPGIPEERLQDVFKPFIRVSEARERGSGGYGLGLAIAQRAMMLHGGRISAENAPEGGLRVYLRVPV